MTLKDLGYIENLFHINIVVYKYESDKSAIMLRESLKRFPQTLNLCAYKNHFCLIRKLDGFCSCYQCTKCKKAFSTRHKLKIHQKSCAKRQSKRKFSNDCFRPKMNIFDEIYDRTGIHIKHEKRFYQYAPLI